MKQVRYAFSLTCIWLLIACFSDHDASDEQGGQNEDIYFLPLNSDI